MSLNVFKIELLKIHWLENINEEDDLCAHGQVRVRIGKEFIADDQNDNWTVSAMALLLLRTLDQNHTFEKQVGDHIIPCCGFNFFILEKDDIVYIPNCNNGINF
jgi:hypothetical protein